MRVTRTEVQTLRITSKRLIGLTLSSEGVPNLSLGIRHSHLLYQLSGTRSLLGEFQIRRREENSCSRTDVGRDLSIFIEKPEGPGLLLFARLLISRRKSWKVMSLLRDSDIAECSAALSLCIENDSLTADKRCSGTELRDGRDPFLDSRAR